MNVSDNDFFGYVGFTLNLEEKACLEASLPLLKNSQVFQAVQFWGKILGVQRDYYVAVATGLDIVNERFYFMSLNLSQWTQLPVISPDDQAKALGLYQRFLGDPAFEYPVGT